MKTILLTIMALSITTGLFASSTAADKARLCKVFKAKTVLYKETMRNDTYAKKTLKSYEKRSKLFCSK